LTLAKCDLSVPTSETTTRAMVTSMPSMRLRSAPHILNSCVRNSNFGAWRAMERVLPLAGSPS
jgi:hypothetical protein